MKKSAVRELVSKEKLDFVCIQETKTEYVDERLACMIWGNMECKWVNSGSVGAVGGLCCVWDSSVFVRQDLWGKMGCWEYRVCGRAIG